MIELTTGLPGNSKTLYTIRSIIDRAVKESRPVFYSGIPELLTNDPRMNGTVWTEIDPTKWMECPTNSIVVIDEAQKTFRARSLGTIPPVHVTDLETHRHLGIDIVMLTQHPSLIDPAVRRLAGRHRHMIRIAGFEMSNVHTWDKVVDKPESKSAKEDAESMRWTFDKTLYGIYKSADAHTMKAKVPKKVWFILAAPVLFGVFAFVAYKALWRGHDDDASVAAAPPAQASVPAAKPVESKSSGGLLNTSGPIETPVSRPDPLQDAEAYVWKETPRVVGLAETKPKYDQLTVPVRVPVPSCIQIGDVRDAKSLRCKCYSQQGTIMPDVEFNMCVQLANNGRFLDFDPDGQRAMAARSDASVQVLRDRPDSPLPQHASSGPAVAVLSDVGDAPVRQVRVTGQTVLSR